MVYEELWKEILPRFKDQSTLDLIEFARQNKVSYEVISLIK